MANTENATEHRAARIIGEYERQGFHRTGTAVDLASAKWLAREVRRAGLKPELEPFALQRVDPITAAIVVNGRRADGVPLFDGGFTGPEGVRGKLGSDIPVMELRPNAAAAGPLGEARRRNQYKAIICITRSDQPTGLTPSNADSFLEPFGPPVLQVAAEHAEWLKNAASQDVQIIAHIKRTPADAFNVTTRIDGKDRQAPPFVIMTPRSGWYSCASERGGGIFCWLELMRRLKSPGRDVLFVASSGHELGHLGINAYIDRRPGIVKKSAGWLHLGANLGASLGGNIVQASDDEFEAMLARVLESRRLSITAKAPRGRVPSGEAEAVHRGGGRYVSTIGRSAWFHHPGDRGPAVIDTHSISMLADAFQDICNLMVAFPPTKS